MMGLNKLGIEKFSNGVKPLNILIVGTGVYVCGRGTGDYGTVMPAICEWKRGNGIGSAYLAGRDPDGIKSAKNKIAELQRNMNVDISIRYFPEGNRKNTQCYKDAIRKIPRPACAIIVTPDNLHREIAGFAMEKGLHTLVVKPLAPTLREVQELIEIQKRNKVYCAVEFHKRFDHANLKLRDAISQGLIGDPLYFLVEYSQRKSIPSKRFIKWVGKTNVFQYLGTHYIDIIYVATNSIPKRVMAIGQKDWLTSKGIDNYDSIQGVIEWEMPSGKNFSSHILTNWIDPETSSAMSDQKIKVIGTKGRFESDQKRRGILMVTDEKGIEEPNPYFCSAYGESGKASYGGYGIDSIMQFLNDCASIEQGTSSIAELSKTRPTFTEALISTAVIEAVRKSLANNGKWINIKIPAI